MVERTAKRNIGLPFIRRTEHDSVSAGRINRQLFANTHELYKMVICRCCVFSFQLSFTSSLALTACWMRNFMFTSVRSVFQPVALKSMPDWEEWWSRTAYRRQILVDFMAVLISLLRTEASVEKGKNGHLNPAFHLKVVGPINKASGHKGVSGVCVW